MKTAKNGEIKTLTPITYIENLKFTGFYVGENKENLVGNVGDVLTIEGDYLNNITSVILPMARLWMPRILNLRPAIRFSW